MKLTILGLTDTIAIIERIRAVMPKKQSGKNAMPFAIEYACLAPIFLKAGWPINAKHMARHC